MKTPVIVLSLITLIAVSAAGAEPGGCDTAGALDYGWRLAVSITNDVKDRARSQERVALRHLERGEVRKALARADRIENWRKAVVLADTASWLLERGRGSQVSNLLTRAHWLSQQYVGWRQDRVAMHVAQGWALQDRTQRIERLGQRYVLDDDCSGRLAVYRALADARSGRLQAGIALLDDLADKQPMDLKAWRGRGYLRLASVEGIGEDERRSLLQKAFDAAGKVPGWMRNDIRMLSVQAAVAIGATNEAAQFLETIDPQVRDSHLPGHVQAPLLGRLALCHAALGQADAVAQCWDLARPMLATDLQQLERPEVLALFGRAFFEAGRADAAGRLFSEALHVARSLINPRPRAMAGVDICLALDGCDYPMAEVRESLNALVGTFDASSE